MLKKGILQGVKGWWGAPRTEQVLSPKIVEGVRQRQQGGVKWLYFYQDHYLYHLTGMVELNILEENLFGKEGKNPRRNWCVWTVCKEITLDEF